MRSVVAFPGTMLHARQMALALHEHGALEAFVTSFAFRPGGALASAAGRLPAAVARRILQELSRRKIPELPDDKIALLPFWEVLRIGARMAGAGPQVTDWLWDRMSQRFDEIVARRWVPQVEAVMAFEYTALETFRAARERGVATVLDLPSLDSLHFKEIQQRERIKYPKLAAGDDGYFDARFQRRYARRKAEIALADVILANSSLTARTHIAAGADAKKVFVVPLAAPPPIATIQRQPLDLARPLRVLWAGSFSIGKGAHYMVEAWNQLKPRGAAILDVYGSNLLSPAMLAAVGEGVVFHGPIAQQRLFQAYEEADVLAFPTLSDGFGFVIGEALSRGLPVITTDQAGAADMVSPDCGLTIPAGDAKALAVALDWCLDHRRQLEDMRQAALSAAKNRQWTGYRRDLIAALGTGLSKAGFQPRFATPSNEHVSAG